MIVGTTVEFIYIFGHCKGRAPFCIMWTGLWKQSVIDYWRFYKRGIRVGSSSSSSSASSSNNNVKKVIIRLEVGTFSETHQRISQ